MMPSLSIVTPSAELESSEKSNALKTLPVALTS